MAINPSTKYSGQIDTSDPTGYPWGQARNVDTPGDGTGTPLEKAWVSDWWGLAQSLLSEASMSPNGNPDKVGASQYLDALKVFLSAVYFAAVPYAITNDYAHRRTDRNVTSEEAAPISVTFSADGSKMYVLGSTADTIYQYTLSTPWDVSSASYDSKSKSVAAEDTTPNDLAFNPTGTLMYICGDANNRIFQYTLSTAWDVSTAAYSPAKNADVSSETTAPVGVEFSSDGSAMFVLGTGSLYQYTLSTPWDVSTASYASKSLDHSSEVSQAYGLAFSSNGKRVFFGAGVDVYEYVLSTAWDLGTTGYEGVGKLGRLNAESVGRYAFSSNGNRLYAVSIEGSTGRVLELYTNRVVSRVV